MSDRFIDLERARLAIKICDRITEIYERNSSKAAEVAAACDEHIDQSGNLLGWVRDYVQILRDDRSAGEPAKGGT